MSVTRWAAPLLLGACGPRGEDLESLWQSARDKGFSGSILVVRDGEVLLDDAAGEAVRGESDFHTDTVASTGSLTKQFTAAAVLAAESDGLLDLDAPIGDHLPDLPAAHRRRTLHELLRHTAGYPESIGRDEAEIRRAAWLAEVAELDPEPGEFAYSNVGYGVAAAVLEEATGQPYEAWLRERLLLPLGMEHTGYDDPDWSGVPIAHGYDGWGRGRPPLALDMGRDHWHVVGNGELLSTTHDLHTWVMALDAGTALAPEQVARAWTSQADRGDGYGYGYGWGIEDWGRHGPAVEHDGSNGAWFAHLAWFPEARLFVCFLSNDRRAWSAQFLWQVVEHSLP